MSRVASTTPPDGAIIPDRHPESPATGSKIPSHFAHCFGCGEKHPTGLHLVAHVGNAMDLTAEFVVLASGVDEIALGIALASLQNRRQVGWITAAFFVAIFPGNISQYVNGIDAFGLDTDQARLTRLFFQPVLVLWALWGTGVLMRNRVKNSS